MAEGRIDHAPAVVAQSRMTARVSFSSKPCQISSKSSASFMDEKALMEIYSTPGAACPGGYVLLQDGLPGHGEVQGFPFPLGGPRRCGCRHRPAKAPPARPSPRPVTSVPSIAMEPVADLDACGRRRRMPDDPLHGQPRARLRPDPQCRCRHSRTAPKKPVLVFLGGQVHRVAVHAAQNIV